MEDNMKAELANVIKTYTIEDDKTDDLYTVIETYYSVQDFTEIKVIKNGEPIDTETEKGKKLEDSLLAVVEELEKGGK